MRPRLLDLFCGAGGAAMGYALAGFDVVGVDIEPQPHYPFEFHQADALNIARLLRSWPLTAWVDALRCRISAIHASPICQGNSNLRHFNPTEYPDLITPMRALLQEAGLPYVIENVPGSPMRPDLMLCGSQFGLAVQRHRWFEFSFGPPAVLMSPCHHPSRPVGVYGHGQFYWENGQKRWRNVTTAEASDAMGIGWMSRKELSQAIPPAYYEFIGAQLLAHIESAAA